MARLSGRPLLDTAADSVLFVDRAVELDRATRALTEDLNLLVSGPRGAGKTSLLRRLTYQLRTGPDGSAPVSFLDSTTVSSVGDLLTRVAHAVGAPEGTDGTDGTGSMNGLERLAALDGGTRHVVVVDGLLPPVAHAAYGQLRDELWQLPVAWVVACSDREEREFLRPPADAFFDTTLRLPPLTPGDMRDLLRRRAATDELSDDAISAVVEMSDGSPRRALDLARHLLLAPATEQSLRAANVHREQALDRLGIPARMLLDELEASGAASASDDGLLARLGWTRSRAAQVLGQLEEQGLVLATDERNGPGRPRRVYRSVELTALAASN